MWRRLRVTDRGGFLRLRPLARDAIRAGSSGVRFHTSVLVLALAIPLGSGQAQPQPRYRLGPDTLRYRLTVDVDEALELPNSDSVRLRVELSGDAHLVLGRRAVAWYGTLQARITEMRSGEGAEGEFDLSDARFLFGFTDDGRVTQVTGAGRQALDMIDGSSSFEDFFISLPMAAFANGQTWMDTLAGVLTENGVRTERAGTRRYLVDGDSSVHGQSGIIVRTTGALRVVSAARNARAPVAVRVDVAEEGITVLTRDGSRMLSRTRAGTLSGRIRAGRSSVREVLPMRGTFVVRIELMPPAGFQVAAGDPGERRAWHHSP